MRFLLNVTAIAAVGTLLAACAPTAGNHATLEDYLEAQRLGTTTTTVTTPTTTFATVTPTTVTPLNTTTTYQTYQQPVVTTPVTSLPTFTIRGTAFGLNSDNLLSSARSDLDRAADSIRGAGGQYSIVGYASTEGDDSYNQRLSERRAASVAAYLVGKGVPSSALIVAGAGETTQFGSDFESNRRVEISPRSQVISGTQTVTSQPIITTTQPLVIGSTAFPVAPSIVVAQ